MTYRFNTSDADSRTVFYGGPATASPSITYQTWTKPKGANWIFIMCVGGGGPGGNSVYTPGSLTTFFRGGSGGCAGGIVNGIFPAFMLPDTLYISPGEGSITPLRGNPSYVTIYPDTTANSMYIVMKAMGGMNGSNTVASTITTNPTQYANGYTSNLIVQAPTGMPWLSYSVSNDFNRLTPNGRSGWDIDYNFGRSVGVASDSIIQRYCVTGGASGGAFDGNTLYYRGGNVYSTSVFSGSPSIVVEGGGPYIAPFNDRGNGGANGVPLCEKTLFFLGGAGGGAGLNGGGSGGNGSYGCGGGGGGVSRSLSGIGLGGNGGPGFVAIYTW